MSNIDTGGPAFPTNRVNMIGEVVPDEEGMTLRDYFAAHAPEPPKIWHGGERNISDVIEWRWYYADAMLKARKQ